MEAGDIFERIGATGQKRYILLAQPCDLMVRNDGKRHPELDHVPVAELVCADQAPGHSEELLYFGSSPSERWYVRLKRVHQVRVCMLDLCVMNKDGVARLVLDGDAPNGLRPSWKARHAILSRLIRRSVDRADLLAPVDKEPRAVTQFKESIGKKLTGALWDEGLFKGELTQQDGDQSVAYDCSRIARASRARAFGLLMAYTASLGRPAFDRDFGVERDAAGR